MLDILQKAFNVQEIQTKSYKEGLFGGKKVTKFFIPAKNIEDTMFDFPFLKNAVKAGLLTKDPKTQSYVTTSKVLSTRTTDKRKLGENQFFSFDGVDKNDRTTLKDALISIDNVKKFARKINLSPKDIRFSIKHKNGNPDEVMNFMEFDPKVLGDTKDEILKNMEEINKVVKFER